MAKKKGQQGGKESAKEFVDREDSARIEDSPFSQERLNDIFKISSLEPDRVISRESSTVEFKESFGWKSLAKYLKTCAAFANAKGGYLVFGIGNRPHTLLGLSGGNLKAFEDIDPEKLSCHFSEYFAPEIHWDIHEYELEGKTYGLIYIHECIYRPVVCRKDSDSTLKEGDIYYRYRGRSERIKYSELRDILDEKRKTEQEMWMQHIARIAKVGVRESAIFDLTTGHVTGTSGSFLVDESLLSQLAFVKEGEFSEVKGKPALRLIGNVEILNGSVIATGQQRIIKTKGIRLSDIVLAFLGLENVREPLEYVKQICFENTGFLPFYYFIKLARVTKDQAIAEIEGVVCRSPARSKLLDRLNGDSLQCLKSPTSDKGAAQKKREYIPKLMNGEVEPTIEGKELEYVLQAIRMLEADAIEKRSDYIRSLLKTWFNKHYSVASGPIADGVRRAICWMDEALYAKQVE